MMRWLWLILLPFPAYADTLVAARTLRAQTMIGPEDLATVAGDVPGALSVPEDAIGMEAKVSLYAGRPIRAGDIGPAALVNRNQTVTILFQQGPLAISTEGRSLGRGAVGDVIKVMNLASRIASR